MKKLTFLFALVATQLQAATYSVPKGADVGVWFSTIPVDATVVHFDQAATYFSAGNIILPRRMLFIVEGDGARLNLGANSNGFTDTVHDQGDAMVVTATRYIIRNFARITGGKRAINLAATLNSEVTDCEFSNQSDRAVSLRFCLLARLRGIQVTNPIKDGIVVTYGDWPGASAMNSQSNNTTLDHCRVYAQAITKKAYTIRDCNGVDMRDCVSEGYPVDYDIYLTARMDTNENAAGNNPVVKSFTCQNLHIEHQSRIASVYMNMPSKAVVVLDNIYWNGNPGPAAVLWGGGQLIMKNIGWWTSLHRIVSRAQSPRITVRDSHSDLNKGDGVVHGLTMGSFSLAGPATAYPGHTVFTPAYINVNNPSQ